MKNDDFVSRLAQLLQRADRLASYNSSGQFGSAQQAAPRSLAEPVHVVQKGTSAIRTVFFGLALMLLSIFTIQIGNAFQFKTFGWVFYVAAALYLLVGVAQFDRGLKRLDFERLE